MRYDTADKDQVKVDDGARARLTTELGPLWLSLSGELPAEAVVKRVHGVGLIRGEYVLRGIGSHVMRNAAQASLEEYLERICAVFSPKQVWYRTSDFEPREIAALTGCAPDSEDENPVLGARGVRRGVLFPQELRVELEVLCRVARRHPNLHVTFPYVGTVAELEFALGMARDAGFPNQFGVMVETPAAAQQAAELGALVERMTVGLNDLSSLFFGAQRGSRFADKTHGSLARLIRSVIEASRGKEAEVVLAGDLSAPVLHGLRTHLAGFDAVTVHYHQLGALIGRDDSRWNDIDHVPRLKRTMSDMLRERDIARRRCEAT